MRISVIGLSHKTAPVDIREKLAFDSEQSDKALRSLKGRFPEAEFILISTCNRVELYSAADSHELATETLVDFLSDFHNIEKEKFKEFLYIYKDENAVRHLLMVASSLDSMVVGEREIIDQTKESYSRACKARSTGKILNRLFHRSFLTSKRVYTKTSIASGRVSVAGVAVELATQLFADKSSAKVIVIGAGQMGQLLVRHFLQIGCKDITIINRSYERALEAAQQNNVTACQWGNLAQQLSSANVVISSASVQDYLFTKDSFSKIIGKGLGKSLLIIDIAVPRNFDPTINEIEDVYLYSIDELSEVAQLNLKAREKDIAKGVQIVYKNSADFMDWFKSRDIGPLIGKMKKQFAQITQNELDKFFVGAREEAGCKDVAASMVKRIVNKLLHCVIQNVDIVARKNGPSEAAKLVDNIVKHAEEISSASNNKEDNCQ